MSVMPAPPQKMLGIHASLPASSGSRLRPVYDAAQARLSVTAT